MKRDNDNVMTNRPLVRHPSLRPLSRDHYQALVQAQRLMSVGNLRGEQSHAVLQDFIAKWESEIAVHFEDEERLLPTLIHSQTQRERLFGEHELLRSMTSRIGRDLSRGTYDAESVKRLGELLHDHVRWEERVLFEGIQGSAEPQSLASLQAETEQIESSRRQHCHCRGVPE